MEPCRELIVVMGPSGCGKSTIGRLLADSLRHPFIEGDDHHPAANKRKLASGRPLTDEDREAWVDGLAQECRARPQRSLVLACSALTKYVQSRLRAESERRVCFVLLDVPRSELVQRLEIREGHFMPAALADSQLSALVPPADALRIDATPDAAAVVSMLCAALGERGNEQDDQKASRSDDGRG